MVNGVHHAQHIGHHRERHQSHLFDLEVLLEGLKVNAPRSSQRNVRQLCPLSGRQVLEGEEKGMVVVCIDQNGAVMEVICAEGLSQSVEAFGGPAGKDESFGVGVNEASDSLARPMACVACPAIQWALRPTLALRATCALVIRSRTA